MTPTHSVTHLLEAINAGDRGDAVAQLLARYWNTLVARARQRLRLLPAAAGYSEDVALSAFHSLIRGIDAHHFPNLDDRNSLHALLFRFVACKTIDVLRREGRFSAVDAGNLEQVFARGPSPEEAAEQAEACQRLFDRLGNDQIRQVALWCVQGFTNDEIAARLNCVPRTVQRHLNEIRRLWQEECSRDE
jgi:RNA polymerase sigma factor (sigma-70 family)